MNVRNVALCECQDVTLCECQDVALCKCQDVALCECQDVALCECHQFIYGICVILQNGDSTAQLRCDLTKW